MTDVLTGTEAFWLFLCVSATIAGGIIFYALRTKGDVFARVSHGLTSFELQAKERPSRLKE